MLIFTVMNHHILSILKQHKQTLFDRYPIKSMALFGSQSRTDFTQESDVDIMVEFSKPIGLGFIRLAHELEDIFQKKVDLVSKPGVKPQLMELIQKNLQYV